MSRVKIDVLNSIYTMGEARKLANFILTKKKAQLLMNFWTHPVTVEIKAGTPTSNISGTLSGMNADLFSYIGFYEGDDPIEPIAELLEDISLGEMTKIGSVYSFEINHPSPSDIWDVTPMPWAEGRSWAEGIEKGISGVGYYMRKESEYSRSGNGIQVKKQIRRGKFKNRQYISKLISDFVRSLNQS